MTENTPRAIATRRERAASRLDVFIALAVLTAIEFVVAVVVDYNVPILIAFAVAKAAVIAYYFMHIDRLWRHAEED